MLNQYGQVDPNWIIALLIGVVGFLLVRILNRIEKRLEVHDKEISEVKIDVARIKERTSEI